MKIGTYLLFFRALWDGNAAFCSPLRIQSIVGLTTFPNTSVGTTAFLRSIKKGGVWHFLLARNLAYMNDGISFEFQPLGALTCLANALHVGKIIFCHIRHKLIPPHHIRLVLDFFKHNFTDGAFWNLEVLCNDFYQHARALLTIYWTFCTKLCFLMWLGTCICILNLAVYVKTPSEAYNSYRTLKTKDRGTFRKRALSISLCCAFKATSTAWLFICWVNPLYIIYREQ